MILTILPAGLGNQHIFEAFEAAGARNTPQFGAKLLVHNPKQLQMNFKYHLRANYEGVKVVVFVLAHWGTEEIRYKTVLEFAVQQGVTVFVLTSWSLEGETDDAYSARRAADMLESSGVRHFFISRAPLDPAHSWELAKETLMLLDSGWQGRLEATTVGRDITISSAGRKYDAHR
jgi:hypothetical protein